ncbi:FAD-binding protein [Comamonas aquatica]|uniref:D-lactate dehydrogenase (cytochrome) n=1 Tax=Comamonas aquatica TaxID=225991 RepID=A0AA43AVV2_9BURK|nr:FAD-linked oxidase C-terminal domain-containing protein [Comamonas aquatica]MDH1426811.1 FAD-binding protein [Comamonas aquatica]MDH1604288.1 FAD-binding protein [Comamonas aquatica]MDH1616180.1 FAD-binding protein [Comamonas aquatica]MDH2004029.1 FAD-binding protein [Comamonas aquatica]
MNAPTATAHLQPRAIAPAFLEALAARFGKQCSTAQAVCEQHGRDEGSIQAPPPVAVVYAESTQDVADAVQLADQYTVPVIAYGAGSSLEGHLLAVQGGISIDVSRMNRVLRVNAEDMTVTVQPGILRKQLNDAIKDQGLFFPIDPGADASIGGMTATRASGTNAVRYGTMRENVLALEVVTASGEVIRTGNRAKKSAAGYDLTRLMVGSEGTLGIFTEITLRLFPLPEAVSAAVCSFPTLADAVHTVIQTIQMGVPIARVELVDGATVAMVNKHSNLTLREEPMLLMEFHGSPNGVKEQAELVQDIAAEFNAQGFEWADTPEERTRLFTARHNAYFAGIQSRPGCRSITTDTCVPISRLADCLLESIDEVNASGIPYFLVGHVGDGNFHFGYLIDPDSADERARAEDLNHRLVRRAIAMEGTCTGEHGIGIHKQDFLREECGDGAIAMMRAIKLALDPKQILNPGKIFAL